MDKSTIDIIAAGLAVIVGKAADLQKNGDFSVSRKDNGSPLSTIDTVSEAALIQLLQKRTPDIPILSEEQGDGSWTASMLGAAPRTFWSLDPIDGTAVLSAGLSHGWNISIGLIEDGMPRYGFVGRPAYRDVITTESRLEGVARVDKIIGLDIAQSVANDPVLWEFNRRLVLSYGYPTNVPSVQSGLDVAFGHTRLWVTGNANHWDLAAVAALNLKAGHVTRRLDGGEIDWTPTHAKMPPIVFAESEALAAEVCGLYLKVAAGFSQSQKV